MKSSIALLHGRIVWRLMVLVFLPLLLAVGGMCLLFLALDPEPASAAQSLLAPVRSAPLIDALPAAPKKLAGSLPSKSALPAAALTPLAGVSGPSFDTRRFFGTGTDTTWSVATGDMNGDGALDIVVGNNGQQNAVYLNDGVGNFNVVNAFGTGSDHVSSVAVGDMNGDGALDIVVGNNGQQNAVYLNNGAGAFTTTAPYMRPFGVATNTRSVAIGDVNGDGALDIATGNDGGQSVVYLNDGTGTFTTTAPYMRTFGTASDRTLSVAMGDVNGDGAPDIVVGNDWQQSIAYLNDGTGHFPSTPEYTRPFGTGIGSIQSVAVGDVNCDGALDLIVGNAGLYSLALSRYLGGPNMVYLNDGVGNFPNTAGYTRTFGTGSDATLSVAVGDMNGDGALDLVVGNDGQLNVVYLNDGAGNFPNTPESARAFGTGTDVTLGVAAGDVNGDGALDLVVGNNGQQNVIYLNDGAGSFLVTPMHTRPFGTGVDWTQSVAVGDVNGDSNLDLVVGNYNNEPNVVYLNDGVGNFPNTAGYTRTFGTGSDATLSVAVGDMNGDGALDLVVGNDGQNMVHLNDGMGNFPATTPYTRPFGTGVDWTQSVAVGDMNGDGALDLIVGNYRQQSVVYLNDGAGNFPNTVGYTRTFGSTSDTTESVAVGDVNSDGALDLVIGNAGQFSSVCWCYSGGQNMVYLNNGTGNFPNTPKSTYPFGTGSDATLSLAVGDINGDGAPDLIVGNYGQQNVVYLNDGTGYFPHTAPYSRYFGTGGDRTRSVATGDMNGDGTLDLIVGNDGQQNAVYLNDGVGNFSTIRAFGPGTDSTFSLAMGDVNGDGTLDLAVGNYLGQNTVYLNGLAQSARLANNPSQLALTRPNPLVNANFVYTNPALRTPVIPTPYTLSDPEGDAVREVRAYFSPDGGGKWYIATAASGTLTQNLTTTLGSTLAFDGIDDYALITPTSTLTGTFTVMAWAQPKHPTATLGILGSRLLGFYDNSFDLKFYQGNKIHADIGTGTSWLTIAADALVTYTVGTWYHIAYVVTPTVYTIYVNGAQSGSGSFNGIPLLFDAAHKVRIGQTGYPNETMNGRIDDVRIYNRALSASEIQSTRFEALNSNEPGLVAYWRLDEGADTVIHDQTANHNDGTLFNNPVWVSGHVPASVSYVYNWDVYNSGFFGASDSVVFRMEAYPSVSSGPNGVPVFQRPYASATTFPFRVRGTQVQVKNEDGSAATNAIVYRLPAGQELDGALFGTGVLTNFQPFHTDNNGYLSGRGQINEGDRLLALAPVLTSTQGYALFYTNGVPQEIGVNAFTVNGGGVQLITVTAQHPLYLFDLDVSLEWDVHNDPNYLALLATNLRRTSEYLYDFTDGQMALGDVYVYQNAAAWNNSHITIRADDRLRPFAGIGGIIITDTLDPQHNSPGDTLLYAPGQVTMGSTWNRYGRPGQMLGDDWSAILAHELGHYLFYHDDVYLGLDAGGNLIPVSTCIGSAMGDLYDRPQNTEFIYNDAYWQANCKDTLAEKTLGRNEWETMHLWYGALVTPTNVLTGPSVMPFGLTTVTVFDPLTPTNTLADPTFYINYTNNTIGSSDARAYLIQSDAGGDWLMNLGSPVGGQNRVVARGAEPTDRLCVFDSGQHQFGCETIEFGDDQLQMKRDENWNPIITVTPVNSETLRVNVSNSVSLPPSLIVQARVFPDLMYAQAPITLTNTGGVYSGTFVLTQTGVVNGNLQVWVNEAATETNPRRETMVAYSVGGNPGGTHGGGTSRGNGGIGTSRGNGGIGTSRGNGGIGTSRGNGGIGTSRGNGGIGQARSGHAPLLSPDGQLIFFTQGNTEFITGTLFTIQSMAGAAELPPGRTQIGQGYSIVASPNAVLPAGSVSVQYLANDVTQAGAREDELTLYFYDGASWRELPTTRDTYFDVVVAPSQGPGVYAVLASVQIPLYRAGWNLFPYPLHETQSVSQALQSIAGQYALVYGYVVTDTADPWKVYAPNPTPPWVNDLSALSFGSYWISATQPVTLYLSGPTQAESGVGPFPPSTFYGFVQANSLFTPTVNMEVEAWVNGTLCAQTKTRDVGMPGAIVFVIDVVDEEMQANCGAAGRTVTFRVNGKAMAQTAPWNNDVLTPLNLSAAPNKLYLPLIRR